MIIWKKFRALPFTVRASIIFLISVWIFLVANWPPFFLFMTGVALVILSVIRVASHFMDY